MCEDREFGEEGRGEVEDTALGLSDMEKIWSNHNRNNEKKLKLRVGSGKLALKSTLST